VKPGIGAAPVKPGVDTFAYAPVAIALLPASGAVALSDASRAGARARTTVKRSAGLTRMPPPTLASVEAERSVSIATSLLVVEPPAAPAMVSRVSGTLIATGDVPPSESARQAPAVVAMRGGGAKQRLDDFSGSLRAGRRLPRRKGSRDPGSPGAVVGPGDVAVLQMPNARHDVDGVAERPVLAVTGAPVRVIALGDGGFVTDDLRVHGAWSVPQHTERIAVIGLGEPDPAKPVANAGLWGWHAGMQLPYVGWSSAIGAGCTIRSRGQGIAGHRQRGNAGWVSGAELTRGVSTVTTRFVAPVTTIAVVVDDPAAFGGVRAGQDLVLALTGASRATDASGTNRPPTVLTSEQRNVVVYDVVPQFSPEGVPLEPVTVTVASDDGWSFVGMLASDRLSAEDVVSIITTRGLDAATNPVAQGGQGSSRLRWLGPTRNPSERER
jgi:hypothetical protein